MPRLSPFAGFRGGPAARVSPSRASHGRLLIRSVSPVRRSVVGLPWVLLLWVLMLTSAVAVLPAQGIQGTQVTGEIVVRAYTFKYQQASEAVAMVYPLLSPKGAIELQPGGNTLVVRDTSEALRRIVQVLKAFDHPGRPLRLEVYVVRASRAAVSPQVQHSDLPEALTKRLRELLAYDVYEMQAQAQLSGAEGQKVIYELGPEYRVSFRFGTILEDQRVKLSGFQIARRAEGRPATNLLQTNLSLWLDQTTSLGLAKSEASREALMLVLTLREGR
jgi:hypothetical protein